MIRAIEKFSYLVVLIVLLPSLAVGQTESEPSDFGKEHDKKIESLLQKLESKDPLVQIETTLELSKEANSGDLPLLVNVLRKGNELPKQLAIIKTLAKIGDPRAGEVLRFEIEHGKGQSVLEAISALGYLKTNWAIPILVNQIPAKRGELKPFERERAVRAIVAIAKINTPRSLDTLKIIGSDFHPEFKELLIWLIKLKEGKLAYSKVDGEIPRARGMRLQYEGVGFTFYYPSQYADAPSRPWLLVCIPDINFQVEELYKKCQEQAVKQKMAVLVPHLHPYHFIEYQSFNVQDRRADKFLLGLLDYLKNHAEVETNEIYLYGANAGSSFVQRFVMSYPRRIVRAVALNGEIVIPDPDVIFPDGLRKTPYAPDIEINLYDYLKSELYLLFGGQVDLKRLEKFEKSLAMIKTDQGIKPRILSIKKEGDRNNFNFDEAMKILFHQEEFK